MKLTGHIVSHTHWDREWYLPFQEFRLKLVDLVDELVDILAGEPDYRYFMLDGQAIVLEDYLAVRPEREEELRRHVESGRLLIGPWYILPDEFLVSGEATIRNLLLGWRVCQRFGPRMNVGYVPDPFGHISQLPQILAGFDIDTAVFRRGLSDEPTLLRWAAADGTQTFVVYLRDGYDNAAWLPTDPDGFTAAVSELVGSLTLHTASPHILLMNGTDHMLPMRELPALMRHANARLTDVELIHSTLPQYLEQVRPRTAADPRSQPSDLPVVRGELRSPKRHHLLPGVLTARMWIKQRNHALETLLERWAEPFSTWAWMLSGRDRSVQAWLAWRYLIQNHPHDSICGCSVDQVHREMATRFDWVEQIAETVTTESLAAIAGQVDTTAFDGGVPMVVFNPVAGPRTDVVSIEVPLPAGNGPWTVVDADGQPVPAEVVEKAGTVIAEMTFDPDGLRAVLPTVGEGEFYGWAIHDLNVQVDADVAHVDISVAKHGEPSTERLQEAQRRVQGLLEREISSFEIRIHTGTLAEVRFLASAVPGYGYRTFALRQNSGTKMKLGELRGTGAGDQERGNGLENEFFEVAIDAADGTLTVVDKRSGAEFWGLNRFVDGGDRGDEYNYCPPTEDSIVDGPAAPPEITYSSGPARRSARIGMTYRLPATLTEDREVRSAATVDIPISTTVSLAPGVPRIDVRTTVNNHAKDHRLRAHFPTPIHTDHSAAESQFDVVERPIDLPADTAGWVEQPVGTHPQRSFVDVTDGDVGLMVANRGLPEYEVFKDHPGSTIALTLLRCVGWLSRDDSPCREGHAGPFLATPEAQSLGEHTFEYALIPHAGDWQIAFAQAHAFSAPLRAVRTGVHRGALRPCGSLIEVEPANFVVTAVKRAEAGDGVIVRGYNIGTQPIEVRMRLNGPADSATRVTLAEEPVQTLGLDADGWVTARVSSRQIVTVKFTGREE